MSLRTALRDLAGEWMTTDTLRTARAALGSGSTTAAAGAGLLAAGAAAGLGAEYLLVGQRRSRPDPDAMEPFGRLPGTASSVTCDDGTELHCEQVGPADAPLTIVFVHGFANANGVWHYQRKALAQECSPSARLVLYDQRGHGRSGTGEPDLSTIVQLGHDLESVLEQEAPTGPVVLVGHSMGGMTILALARRRPELFGDRVIGVMMIATSMGKIAEVTFGFPAYFGRVSRLVLPTATKGVQIRPDLVESARRLGTDLAWLATRYFGYGGRQVPRSIIEYTERMTATTPIETIAQFYQPLMDYDELESMPVLGRCQTTIMIGLDDVLTPVSHSEQMASACASAELVKMPGAGHMLQLERPELVTLHLRALISRAWRARPAAVNDAPAGS